VYIFVVFFFFLDTNESTMSIVLPMVLKVLFTCFKK
jgi:hypothetical protein